MFPALADLKTRTGDLASTDEGMARAVLDAQAPNHRAFGGPMADHNDLAFRIIFRGTEASFRKG